MTRVRWFFLCLCLGLLAGFSDAVSALTEEEASSEPAVEILRQEAHALPELAVKRFTANFRKTLREAKIPGAAFVIVENGQVRAVETYGVRTADKNSQVDRHTVFPLASVSKTFAGTLAAKMVREGHFSLQEPVRRYVPELKIGRGAHADSVKIEHLLSHATGLVPNAYDNLLESGQPVDKILPRYEGLKPVCKPGQCYGYQNILFSLIEPVMEQSSGYTYEALLMEKLIGPLGMQDTGVGFEAFTARENRVSTHVKSRRQWLIQSDKPYYYALGPAAGVSASIVDLGTWLLAQMGHRDDVLDGTVRTLLHSPRTKTRKELYKRNWRDVLSEADYGLGWRLYEFGGQDLVYHGGALRGVRSSVAFSKDRQIGVAMLANADTRLLDELNISFWRLAFE